MKHGREELRREDLSLRFSEMVMSRIDGSRELSNDELLDLIEETIRGQTCAPTLTVEQRRRAKKDVFHALRGWDILEEALQDEDVTEIMVNGPEQIFLEKDGRLVESEYRFASEHRLETVVRRIASSANRSLNESQPIADIMLEDGARANIVLPPISLNGIALTIRKFPKERITMERLVKLGSISQEAVAYLKVLVRSGYNIFISGGTGAGKTTFLNALSEFIDPSERVITVEDSAELQLQNIPNLVRLEVRNANMEGNHAITIRDLIKCSLRMRPSRIIVGEVRDAASIDMLQSLNTGHNGMSTGHANSPADMLSRIETMVLLGEEIPLLAVRKQIASAIDIIVQLGRLRDKSRRVLEITEVLDCKDGEIRLNPLFRFQEEGQMPNGTIVGGLYATGGRLVRREKLLAAGECLPEEAGMPAVEAPRGGGTSAETPRADGTSAEDSRAAGRSAEIVARSDKGGEDSCCD